MTELTDKEKQLLAFALFTAGMRMGPAVFDTLEQIGLKTDCGERLKLFASDWMNYSKNIKEAENKGVGLFRSFVKSRGSDEMPT